MLNTPIFWLVAIASVAFYLAIIAFAYRKRIWPTNPKPAIVPVAQVATPATSLLGSTSVILPSKDQPLLVSGESDGISEEDEEAYYLMLMDLPPVEYEPITMHKEAERVIERIQRSLDQIQSRPANPEEVVSKVNEIVSDYTFFFDTEYYEAINRYVTQTLERDCDLELSEKQLQALWLSAKAA